MSSRLILLVGLMACTVVGCREQGAVKLTVSFPKFKPGCIRVSIKDAQNTGEERTVELKEELSGKKRGESVKVAAFREEGWGETLTVTASGFEQQCSEKAVYTTSASVTVGKGIAESELTLVAEDMDEDGYVSVATGGTDCQDDVSAVNPGRSELCNGKDDNCDGKPDEGFESVGQQCGSGGTCQTWTCDDRGTMNCVERTPTWYRDEDGDGEGDPTQGLSVCGQPAGYVNNSRDCDDRNKDRYSTAKELCNGFDDNCNTVKDEGFDIGASCSDDIGCGGTKACGSTTQSVCVTVTSTWYPDADTDGHGANTGKKFCGTTKPAGHVASSDDCDDTKNTVHPGAPEVCDSLDNNCNSQKDEGFNIGAACNEYSCAGTRECATLSTTQCKLTTQPTRYYVDNDGDGYGETEVLTCSAAEANYVTQGGDCNDGNPYTHPGAAELCDRENNDCDAATPDVCSEPPEWTAYSSVDENDVWNSVALLGQDGVWAAGGKKVHLRKAGQTTFEDISAVCETGNEQLNSVTSLTSQGYAVMGGRDGFLARYYPETSECKNKGRQPAVQTHIQGVFHFTLANGDIENHSVGANMVNETSKGRAFHVVNDNGATYMNESVRYELADIHGTSRDTLFAVGQQSRIYRFNTGTKSWDEENVPSRAGNLNGVWVVNSRLAYAVGDGGTLYSWNGAAWSKVSGVPNENLSAVVAFGTKSIYVTTLLGTVYRYNGQTWEPLFTATGSQLRDIAASNPGNIWVVGSKGGRYHWPQ